MIEREEYDRMEEECETRIDNLDIESFKAWLQTASIEEVDAYCSRTFAFLTENRDPDPGIV